MSWELKFALTDSGFLLMSAQNCKKCTFLDSLSTKTWEGNMEARQMTSRFHLSFLLFLLFYLKIVKIYFHVVQLCSILSWNFGQKLLSRTAHHTLLENRHHKGTKNPYYILSVEGGSKKGTKHICHAQKSQTKNQFIYIFKNLVILFKS